MSARKYTEDIVSKSKRPAGTSDKNYALPSKSILIHRLLSLPLMLFYINVGRLHHHYINHE